MQAKGYPIDKKSPDRVKNEIAKKQGVPLKEGYNGQLTSKQAGKVGGPIRGNIAKELVKMAQEQMKRIKQTTLLLGKVVCYFVGNSSMLLISIYSGTTNPCWAPSKFGPKSTISPS